jgi:CubicO group peptidase (beta-lactamase class C family)
MKNSNYYLLCIFFTTILISCNPKESINKEATGSSTTFSESYIAPTFVNDDRIEKIRSIAPELQQFITEHGAAENIPGIAYGIVVDNELVVSSATGFMNLENESLASPESAFRIASMTKSFTAMAIMKLRDEGKLSLSNPASLYIPEMASLEYLTADSPAITIENLLTMTAGFPEDNPWGDRQLDESDEMLMNLFSGGVSFSNAVSYEFEYSNTGYALLGNIVSRVSGIAYQEYITNAILRPLGMEQTYWEYEDVPEGQLAIGYRWEDEQWKLEPMLHDGSYGAMGGLITTIEDFSKYVSFQLSAWPPSNEEDNGPVKRSSLREMQTPKFAKLYANATDYNGNTCAVISGYGYGLGIRQDCNGVKSVSHGGALPGFGSNYVFYPEYGVGIMAFCNLTYTSPWPFMKISKLLLEKADLKPRQLPVSTILKERKEQITELIQYWDPELETKIIAENFYLDKSRDRRMKEIQAVLDKAGPIQHIEMINPNNQLRGSYNIQAENGSIAVFFTLTPEKIPKVQSLYVSFKETETK